MGVLAWIGTRLLRFMPGGGTPADNPIRRRHDNMAEKARRKADRQGLLYDPYPDDRKKPRVTIWLRGQVGSRSILEAVDLDNYSFRELNLRRGSWRREWLVDKLIEAHQRLVPRLDVLEHERAERLAELRRRNEPTE